VGRSAVRGIRGAINVSNNTKCEIIPATRELLIKMAKANHVKKEDISSIFFTMTADLDAVYPAAAARELGWINVPLLCAVEVSVPDSLPQCIRILMQVNTELSQQEIIHIYLREARQLRADLVTDNT
jgi:chorismate mutase